jgi:starvation-inducible DNA-binding protein
LNGSQSRGHVLDREHAGLHEVQTAFIQLLADTMTLRDLYAKHGEQASGPLALVFQLICQRHCVEQARLVDILAAHIRTLGGEVLIMAADVAAVTRIARPPRGRESSELQAKRLLDAHEGIARQAVELVTSSSSGSMSTVLRDRTMLIASEVVLSGKLQIWLLSEHLRHASDTSTALAQTSCIASRLVLPFC